MLLDVTFPPSANTHWRMTMINGAPRMLLSAKGRSYRTQVVQDLFQCGFQPVQMFKTERLALWVTLCPPDRRVRDIDNFIKSLLDALAGGHVFYNDSQIDKITIERGAIVKDGRAYIDIQDMHTDAA